MEPKRLFRSTRDRKLAGVCGGIAQYFNVDSTLVRVITILLFCCAGGGLIAYLILAFVMPVDSMYY